MGKPQPPYPIIFMSGVEIATPSGPAMFDSSRVPVATQAASSAE